jgi:hypothetical protein
MKDHEQLKEGSQAISRRDESQGNKKAKQDHPEAPEPVIGMNEERGSVSNLHTTLLPGGGATYTHLTESTHTTIAVETKRGIC